MSVHVRCGNCGRRFDRPGCPDNDCCWAHVAPTLAQQIVEDIETNLDDRNGMSWGGLDDETLDELRDKLAEIVEARLKTRETVPSALPPLPATHAWKCVACGWSGPKAAVVATLNHSRCPQCWAAGIASGVRKVETSEVRPKE